MRRVLFGGLISGVALIGWLIAGRRVVTLLDRVTLGVVERRSVEQLIYNDGILEFGDRHVDLANASYVKLAQVTLQSTGQVVLESNGRQFRLGTGQALPYIRNLSKFTVVKDQGDDVVLTVEQSRISWLTPFDLNFMGGFTNWRRRNAYIRLRWTKNGGESLHMLWQTEQAYQSVDGWSPPRIEAIIDGLIEVRIHGR